MFKGFVGKHWCFKSDVATNRKPVEGVNQWSGVGELEVVENKSCSSILN